MSLKLSRRGLLKAGCATVLSSFVYSALDPRQGVLKAAGSDGKFILYIHCGSWDGWASGLLQPQSTSAYPKGAFKNDMVVDPVNPLMGRLSSSGSHILNHYAQALGLISDDLFHATGFSQSVDHNVAEKIQSHGVAAGHPSWTAGFAQGVRDTSQPTAFVAGENTITFSTPNVAAVQEGGSIRAFREQFADPSSIPGLPMAGGEAFMNAAKQMYKLHHGPSVLPTQFESTYTATHSRILRGLPEIADSSPTVASLNAAMAKSETDAIIDRLQGAANDGDAIKNHEGGANSLREQLKLAGALAKHRYAYGMRINLQGEDRHMGSSAVETARLACLLWTQLSQFWSWVKANGLQDRILVVVSHEFARSRWNESSETSSVMVDGKPVNVRAWGTDHDFSFGAYFLNGKVPEKSRIGGVLDGFDPAGSSAVNSAPTKDVKPYTSMQLVGTMLMRCFPGEFLKADQPESGRVVRSFWPDFQDSDVILPLLKA